ncbi:hypothetical protein [Methylobacterium nodulans]|uniref:Uncharacterized protein n=1 Tax=Methylobacterium nodulans (strain LMG 21967 / CNCM I-2342 / ORS 2060) TaxID=460265 RepID=B8IAZ1_METNO|nr:hypothetical protein [Methylobacterium nodulans]ACL55384.1 conserved hypothetical protein [Methylobacterium nodulans ORS 2060]
MQQGRTPGAAARGDAPPLLRPHGLVHGRYAAAPAFDRTALMAASLGAAFGTGLLALIGLAARAAL